MSTLKDSFPKVECTPLFHMQVAGQNANLLHLCILAFLASTTLKTTGFSRKSEPQGAKMHNLNQRIIKPLWKGLFSLIQNVFLAKPFFKIIASIFKSTTSKINAYNFSSDLPQRTSNLQAFQNFTCSSFLVEFLKRFSSFLVQPRSI